ncbi:pilus assembly protein [Rhodobacteraceae bacterium W635]|uniref:TadE/TadG family type IV pilus assembly protein n=1 Tax=Nioella halotolerans TaxID=2303578 RepID=UPI000E3EC2CD|nr:pilus assembly protein [Rhodobacteraceae bacterium W635]
MWGLSHIFRFARREDANATVEFVIVFPVIIMLFIAAFETSMLLTRQVMLERTLDQSVRHLRLTTGLSVTHDEIRENICDNTVVLNNCTETLVLDLRPIDQETYALPDYHTMCLGQDGEVHPANRFNPGGQNELMLIRACARVDRILPISGLGLQLTRDDAGAIHVTAATIFVNEPQ